MIKFSFVLGYAFALFIQLYDLLETRKFQQLKLFFNSSMFCFQYYQANNAYQNYLLYSIATHFLLLYDIRYINYAIFCIRQLIVIFCELFKDIFRVKSVSFFLNLLSLLRIN